jgi:hypothetical protein
VQFADQFTRENPGSFADVLGDIGGFSSSSLVGTGASLLRSHRVKGWALQDAHCMKMGSVSGTHGYSWVLSIRKCSSVRKGTVEH